MQLLHGRPGRSIALAFTLGIGACAAPTTAVPAASPARPPPETSPASAGGAVSGAAVPASSACSGPEHRQFDFWLGDWDVQTPDGKQAGTNTITSVLGGCVVQESWRGQRGVTGTSVNIYDATRKKWHQSWVDSSGQLLLLDGELIDGKMTLSGQSSSPDGKKLVERITWSSLGPGRVRQLWEQSADGGASWSVVFDGAYLKKR